VWTFLKYTSSLAKDKNVMSDLVLNATVFIYLVFCLILSCGLTLWINHQRPPPSTGHDDCIVNRETVSRKSSHVPCPDDNRFAKCRYQRKVLSTGNAKFCAQLVPVSHKFLQKGKKVRSSLCSLTRHIWRAEVQLHTSLTLALHGGEWLTSCFTPLPAFLQRTNLVGPRAGLKVLGTKLSLTPIPRFKPQDIQPVA
jgi:hypothetical protein